MAPYTIKWGILATGGIAQSKSLNLILLLKKHLTPSSLHKRHPHEPCHPRRHRHPPFRRSSRFIFFCLPSLSIPQRCQSPRRGKSIRFLRRTSCRPERRHNLRRHTPLPPLPKHNALSRSRETRSLREGIHSQCFTSQEARRDCESKEVVSDGSCLDEILSSQYQGSRIG